MSAATWLGARGRADQRFSLFRRDPRKSGRQKPCLAVAAAAHVALCARRALEIIEQWTGFLSGKFLESQSLDLSPELWRVVEKRASADANERVRCAATRALGKLAGARVERLTERRRMAGRHGEKEDVGNEEAFDARCCGSLVALVKAGSAPELLSGKK